MKAPGVEPGAQAPSLSLRALFCYFRRASSESELNQFSELTLFLPRRSGSLQVEGDDVGPAEASLQLRREKTGVYVNMSSLLVTGPCLPFEIGVRTGAEEQRWLVGELRHFDGGEGGRPGGWGLRCSTTAAQGGAFLRDLCADIEVLVCCDVAPGHPACISAHAQLPTVGGRTLRMRGRRPSSLEVIAEDEKCEPPSLEQPGTLGRTASDAGDRASPFEAQESLEWDPSGGEGDFLSESWLGDYQGSLGDGDGRADLTWFSAGLRVGMGVGLGMCIGVGLGVGILVNSYRRTSATVSNKVTGIRDGILSYVK